MVAYLGLLCVLLVIFILPFESPCEGCSSFTLDKFPVSGRTRDNAANTSSLAWYFLPHTIAPPSTGVIYDVLGFAPGHATFVNQSPNDLSGLNSAGLSCDRQHLLGSLWPSEPNSSTASDNVDADFLCPLLLGRYATVREVTAALEVNGGHLHIYSTTPFDHHFALRDGNSSLIIEAIGGDIKAYTDRNDNGTTGFGALTNEPEFPWMVTLLRNRLWKHGLSRPAVGIPGDWYPDSRIERIVMIKGSFEAPASVQQAIQQAAQVINSISIPSGPLPGTDFGGGEGSQSTFEQTLVSTIYDHARATVYFRTADNALWQRLCLKDLAGMKTAKKLPLVNSLPWYSDAAHAFTAP